jgi:hypothetical protein
MWSKRCVGCLRSKRCVGFSCEWKGLAMISREVGQVPGQGSEQEWNQAF